LRDLPGLFDRLGLDHDEAAGRLAVIAEEGAGEGELAVGIEAVQVGEVIRARIEAHLQRAGLVLAEKCEMHETILPSVPGCSWPLCHSWVIGRVISCPMAVFTSRLPSMMRATASVIGMSMPFFAATPEATEAAKAPSTRSPDQPAASPSRPSAMPKRRLRDWWLVPVSTRSPRPESPVTVAPSPPWAATKRDSSASPREISAARAESPSSAPSMMPQAIASTFFSAPPSCTPMRSVEG